MSYKTIMTFLPSPERAAALLDVVLPIARMNDAHHIGLHVVPRVFTMYAVAEAQIPQDVIEAQEKALREKAKKVEDVFEEKAGSSGVTSEWRCREAEHADLAEDIIDQARCAELIVVGLEKTGDPDAWTDLPAHIAMQTGRPVLVVPNAGDIESIGKRALVAWNGSREAARAAFDAVPLMLNAESVRVVAIDPAEGTSRDDMIVGEELALSLARHAIKAEAAPVRGSKVSVGNEILNQLSDNSCDLLVMGCYGHSRLREAVFGGATRELLQHMTVPVLMSH